MNSFNNFTSHLKPNNKIKKEREQSLSLMIPQVQSIPLEGDDNLNTVQQMASNHIALSQSAADQQSSKGGKTPRSKKSSRSKDFKSIQKQNLE